MKTWFLYYFIKKLFHTILYQFKSSTQLKLELQSGTLNLGQNWWYFVLSHLHIWSMTLKNNTAPLLYYMKLCASFQIHQLSQTSVTVHKRSIQVKIGDFLVQQDLSISQMTLKKNRAPVLCYIKLCVPFQSHCWIQTAVTVRKPSIRVKMGNFFSRVTFKFQSWPWKSIGHLSYAASTFGHHFIAIRKFKQELQSTNTQFGSKFTCHLQILGNTLKNNRAPLLSIMKLYASVPRHMCIQTGVAVGKRLIGGVITSVTLNFYLWPSPFAWTSLLSLVIPRENFMMISWWEHTQKGVRDRGTDVLNHS